MEKLAEEPPALVLLDIELPGISGNEVLQQIRARWNAFELPVIMLTSNSDSEDVLHSFRLGASDFVNKALPGEILIRRIQTHIHVSSLGKQSGEIQQARAIQAIVATYNHEINNPLCLALVALDRISRDNPDNPSVQRLEEALYRISDIVKKIKSLEKEARISLEEYTPDSKMVKLKAS